MNASELIETINLEIMDDTLTRDRTLPFLNRAQRAIAKAVNFPDLITVREIILVADQPSSPLPDDYQKNLFKSYVVSDGREIDVMNSRKSLQDKYGSNKISTGSVYAVAPEGRQLFCALIPKEDLQIEIHYYRYPDDLRDSTSSYPVVQDDPDMDDALMYWVKWKYYQFIEQGLEGQKPDTQYNLNEYLKAVRRLKLSFREGVSLPDPPQVEPAW